MEGCLAHVQQPSNVPLPAVLIFPGAGMMSTIRPAGISIITRSVSEGLCEHSSLTLRATMCANLERMEPLSCLHFWESACLP